MAASSRHFSSVREAIYISLCNVNSHPTAQDLWQRLRADYPSLGLSTVYRNLREFCENGRAVSVGITATGEHFDGITSPHCHFYCTRCGNVFDMLSPVSQPDFGDAQAPGKIEHAELKFFGICDNCAQKDG